MPASDDDDFDTDDSNAAETSAAARREPQRQPVGAARGTGDLLGAVAELEAAQDAYEAAQDALADLEGRIVVLEVKAESVAANEATGRWQEAEAREELAHAKRAFNRAGHKLARAESRLAAAIDQVDAEHAIRSAATDTEAGESAPQPRFATVDLFVELFVLPNWVHRYVAKEIRWCDRWWEHAEAITRLEAIWEAFEVMRLQPAPSLSTWLRDHFDVHMRTLTDPGGVFYNCDFKEHVHRPETSWPVAAAPEGMFAAIEGAQIERALDVAAGQNGSTAGAERPAAADKTDTAHRATAATDSLNGTKHTTGVTR